MKVSSCEKKYEKSIYMHITVVGKDYNTAYINNHSFSTQTSVHLDDVMAVACIPSGVAIHLVV
jgi:hypothetical protein